MRSQTTILFWLHENDKLRRQKVSQVYIHRDVGARGSLKISDRVHCYEDEVTPVEGNYRKLAVVSRSQAAIVLTQVEPE